MIRDSAHIDAAARQVLYRDFTIQEVYLPGRGNAWEWCSDDASANGTCQTLFECIHAVDAWHMKEEAA